MERGSPLSAAPVAALALPGARSRRAAALPLRVPAQALLRRHARHRSYDLTLTALRRGCPRAVQHGFEEEHLEPRTGYSLDLALPSSRVAVDGPSHFLLPDGRGVRKPNGPTLLKRRLLAAAGWRVISVPFYGWNGFATAKERQTYLQGAVAPLLG